MEGVLLPLCGLLDASTKYYVQIILIWKWNYFGLHVQLQQSAIKQKNTSQCQQNS